ncbi:hypothetical protein PQE16_gp36 [Arthrobacter phage Reedo]|uniref:Uncharacterized protein n=1 Tax=Arthrobacter phage Reedo TaxID=2910755 RepID=A0AA49BN48_9CAUD|nr:hypothetical protein PQE16_gp36 [Arthrobacter phage Reedo]UJQ86826.1 hypothetical protein SEA_REEDO_36 [Arthrobacter phage Reedo]
MEVVKDPSTGTLPVVPGPDRLAETQGTFILLPVIGEPDQYLAVFDDGSYTRWIPGQISP